MYRKTKLWILRSVYFFDNSISFSSNNIVNRSCTGRLQRYRYQTDDRNVPMNCLLILIIMALQAIWQSIMLILSESEKQQERTWRKYSKDELTLLLFPFIQTELWCSVHSEEIINLLSHLICFHLKLLKNQEPQSNSRLSEAQ